jgi:hypothetical protein
LFVKLSNDGITKTDILGALMKLTNKKSEGGQGSSGKGKAQAAFVHCEGCEDFRCLISCAPCACHWTRSFPTSTTRRNSCSVTACASAVSATITRTRTPRSSPAPSPRTRAGPLPRRIRLRSLPRNGRASREVPRLASQKTNPTTTRSMSAAHSGRSPPTRTTVTTVAASFPIRLREVVPTAVLT